MAGVTTRGFVSEIRGPKSAHAQISEAYERAHAAWLASGGCASCGGNGFVSRNWSDTLDYTDFRDVECDACHGQSPAGRFKDSPAHRDAEAFQESFIPKPGRWARSLTTRGRLHGVEGAIVETETHGAVKVVTESGMSVWLSSRYEVDPSRACLAARMVARTNPHRAWEYWLTSLETPARSNADAVDVVIAAVQSSAQAKDLLRSLEGLEDVLPVVEASELREALLVRQDQLAEQEPAEPARWVSTPNGWRLKGPAVRPGRVFVVKKGGTPQWVEVSHVESDGLGVPAR